MKFQPKTEKQIAEAGLWPKGDYAFEILEAEDTTSKSSGNDMIKLKVKIFNDAGQSQNVFDYLLPDTMEYKLRHIAEACDLLEDYERGDLQAYQFVGKTGWCKVNVSKDKTGQYPDKNGIADYLTSKPASKSSIKEVLKDDSIPF